MTDDDFAKLRATAAALSAELKIRGNNKFAILDVYERALRLVNASPEEIKTAMAAMRALFDRN